LRNLVRRDPFTESRKEGSVYGKIPYEPGFLTGPDSLRAWIPYDSASSEADCEYPLYLIFICVREYVVKTEMECLSHKRKRRL